LRTKYTFYGIFSKKCAILWDCPFNCFLKRGKTLRKEKTTCVSQFHPKYTKRGRKW
jgi:hypothetical protein